VATDWIQIGPEKMAFSRKKLRLSHEDVRDQMAHNNYRLKTSRTYSRWEQRGEVPREALPAVAAVLGLDLGQILAEQPSRVPWQRVEDVLVEVQATQRSLAALLGEQRDVVGLLQTVGAQQQQIVRQLKTLVDRLEPGAEASS